MDSFVLLAIRTKHRAFCMLLVIFLCYAVGICEPQQLQTTTSNNFPSVTPLQNEINKSQSEAEAETEAEEKGYLPVFTMEYDRIQVPFEFTLWILLASFVKIGFQVYHKITIWFPESCLLIGIGLITGAIMYSMRENPPAVLSSHVFFLYMLPPIVLDNGYFMPTRPFFENIGTVMWYAVVGTLWNSIGIGLSLFAICHLEVFGLQDINLQENFLFASIISAVDPVAAINVFEDVGVHEQIHIVIFGERLFNDAVTVVLYSMFAFIANMPVVDSMDVILGVARFFVVAIGGILSGLVFGFMAAFTSRFTNKVRSIEPLFIFLYSYLAYLVAELFVVSSVLAIITCAITMKYYVEENVSQRSCTTIRHVVKMLASISETLIFFFLGVVTVTTDHEWNWAYILFTLLFAFIWRGLGILVLTQIINPFRTIQFNLKDQFGLAYGGLRGAICSALVFTLPENTHRRNLFITASVAIIIFTVFVQGISIRPIVKFIKIRRTHRDDQTINMEIHTRMMEHVVCGIEDLCGQWGHYYWKDKFKKFNDRILRRILLRDTRAESSIVSLYKKLELQNAIELLDTPMGYVSAAPSLVSLNDEKKEVSRPKRKFLAADIKKMHDILSKNMYKIRTLGNTSKYNLPDNSSSREILVRRHAIIRRSLRAQSFREQPVKKVSESQNFYTLQHGGNLDSAFELRRRSHGAEVDRFPSSSESPHSSSSSLAPKNRLNTINELQSTRESPGSSTRGRKPPVPLPRRRSSHRADEDVISEHPAEEQEVPPQGWVPENRDRGGNDAENPLLRHSSERSQHSQRQ